MHKPLNFPGIDGNVHFDGETYIPSLDKARLTGQLQRVYSVLSDGQWYSLRELSILANGPESSIGARLRDLRKDKFGGYTVDRKRLSGGLFEYRLAIDPQQEMF